MTYSRISTDRFECVWSIHFMCLSLICFQDIVTELGTLSTSEERAKVIDFTKPILETYGSALTTTKLKSNFYIMEPLRYSLWLLYIGMAVVVGVAVCTFENINHGGQVRFPLHKPYYFCSAMWNSLCIILNQGKYSFCHDYRSRRILQLISRW